MKTGKRVVSAEDYLLLMKKKEDDYNFDLWWAHFTITISNAVKWFGAIWLFSLPVTYSFIKVYDVTFLFSVLLSLGSVIWIIERIGGRK